MGFNFAEVLPATNENIYNEISNKFEFPLQIFPSELINTIRSISHKNNVPESFLGSAIIWAISVLSGNMYKSILTDNNIIYGMLIGDSSAGKTVAPKLLFTDLIADLEKDLNIKFEKERKQWKAEQYHKRVRGILIHNDNSNINPNSTIQNEPVFRSRFLTDSTQEGIQRQCQDSPCGFGMFFAEGGKMLSSPNAYKKDNSSVDMWNIVFDGDLANSARKDRDNQIFLKKVSVSVLIGLQPERVTSYFNRDIDDSGLTYRFLFVPGKIKKINEEIDLFNSTNLISEKWKSKLIDLYNSGTNWNGIPMEIEITDEAKKEINKLEIKIAREFNTFSFDVNNRVHKMIKSYSGKLFIYRKRFLNILAILQNHKKPVITVKTVNDMKILYDYFKNTAHAWFEESFQSTENIIELSFKEEKFYNNLPDKFPSKVGIQTGIDMGLGKQFFKIAFNRKYKHGFIEKENNYYRKIK